MGQRETPPMRTEIEQGKRTISGPFTKSYWPADTSAPIVEWTVGEALRRVAAETPDTTALVAGSPNPRERGRWTCADLLEHHPLGDVVGPDGDPIARIEPT